MLNEVPENPSTDYQHYQVESRRRYEEALQSLPNPEPIEDYKDCLSLQESLVHKTFLEELVFWTVKFEFPQKIVCLLLHMLPDPDYKVSTASLRVSLWWTYFFISNKTKLGLYLVIAFSIMYSTKKNIQMSTLMNNLK